MSTLSLSKVSTRSGTGARRVGPNILFIYAVGRGTKKTANLNGIAAWLGAHTLGRGATTSRSNSSRGNNNNRKQEKQEHTSAQQYNSINAA